MMFRTQLRNTEPELPGEIDINNPTEFRWPATHLHIGEALLRLAVPC